MICSQNSKKKDVRINNIEAAKAVADAVRTSLGPRGMDKMVGAVINALTKRVVWSCFNMCVYRSVKLMGR